MPHAHSAATSTGGDDLGSTDEVKVFKDEGDGEDEKSRSENLLEEKSSLIDWTESEEKSAEPYAGKLSVKSDLSPVFGKLEPPPHASFNMGYLMAPYPYANGGAHPLPVSMLTAPRSLASCPGSNGRVPAGSPPRQLLGALDHHFQTSKMGLSAAGGGLSLFCHGGELGQPPPAHMGIPPPYQLDTKLAGLARSPMYPFPGGAYPYPMLSPEMSQVAASWHTPSMYPISSAASGFRSPYPSALPITSSSLTSDFYRFSPSLLGPGAHPLSPHPLAHPLAPPLVPAPAPLKPDGDSGLNHSRYSRSLDKSSSGHDKPCDASANSAADKNKKPHIKKPLNAFMLYMKEMRAKVVAECTLKESAAINQILGRRWHSLSREEQAKYYEKARHERQLHMQLYPGWSARDNYGYGSKKKKRKKERSPAELGGNNLKKCRARYGLDQQSQWCKPCRRKKKCIRYMEALAAAVAGGATALPPPPSPASSEPERDVKLEELSSSASSDSVSSPGGLSALSSLTSPSALASLASPLTPLETPPPPRHPVGTNPHDANNPLSVNQLTGRTNGHGAYTGEGASSSATKVISVS